MKARRGKAGREGVGCVLSALRSASSVEPPAMCNGREFQKGVEKLENEGHAPLFSLTEIKTMNLLVV